jgi:septal ring factor EnvC (AmiA/AmiB activator)
VISEIEQTLKFIRPIFLLFPSNCGLPFLPFIKAGISFLTFTFLLLMASTVDSLIDALKSLLLQDPEDLMEDYEDFASLATNLRNFSWRLTPPQHEFLDSVLALRDQMIKDFPFILAVEESRCHSQRTIAVIFDEMWLTKEGMRMYESNLAVCFDQEEDVDHQLTKLRAEIDQLETKKRRLKEDIKDDVARLLEKRRALLELQDRMRTHDRHASNVHGDLEIAQECRNKIQALWDSAREAADQA